MSRDICPCLGVDGKGDVGSVKRGDDIVGSPDFLEHLLDPRLPKGRASTSRHEEIRRLTPGCSIPTKRGSPRGTSTFPRNDAEEGSPSSMSRHHHV